MGIRNILFALVITFLLVGLTFANAVLVISSVLILIALGIPSQNQIDKEKLHVSKKITFKEITIASLPFIIFFLIFGWFIINVPDWKYFAFSWLLKGSPIRGDENPYIHLGFLLFNIFGIILLSMWTIYVSRKIDEC